jgi:hypothetical protein
VEKLVAFFHWNAIFGVDMRLKVLKESFSSLINGLEVGIDVVNLLSNLVVLLH